VAIVVLEIAFAVLAYYCNDDAVHVMLAFWRRTRTSKLQNSSSNTLPVDGRTDGKGEKKKILEGGTAHCVEYNEIHVS
jgi:hypothetical protein